MLIRERQIYDVPCIGVSIVPIGLSGIFTTKTCMFCDKIIQVSESKNQFYYRLLNLIIGFTKFFILNLLVPLLSMQKAEKERKNKKELRQKEKEAEQERRGKGKYQH